MASVLNTVVHTVIGLALGWALIVSMGLNQLAQ